MQNDENNCQKTTKQTCSISWLFEITGSLKNRTELNANITKLICILDGSQFAVVLDPSSNHLLINFVLVSKTLFI